MSESQFQIDKVFWERGRFKPWHISEHHKGKKLTDVKLKNDAVLLIIEQNGEAIGFLKNEIIYHHVVQGHFNNEPFMISYCVMCNAGVVMKPIINDEYHLFEAVGVYNGQLLNQDLKTNSLWNHLLGECLHGDYVGEKLETSYLKETNLEDAKSDYPNLQLYVSGQHKVIKTLFATAMTILDRISIFRKNFLPDFFIKTIVHEDRSLPRMTKGLVVKINDNTKFYETNMIQTGMMDEIDGEVISIYKKKIPYALDSSKNRPFQMYMRWYAFKINFPKGQLFTLE